MSGARQGKPGLLSSSSSPPSATQPSFSPQTSWVILPELLLCSSCHLSTQAAGGPTTAATDEPTTLRAPATVPLQIYLTLNFLSSLSWDSPCRVKLEARCDPLARLLLFPRFPPWDPLRGLGSCAVPSCREAPGCPCALAPAWGSAPRGLLWCPWLR